MSHAQYNYTTIRWLLAIAFRGYLFIWQSSNRRILRREFFFSRSLPTTNIYLKSLQQLPLQWSRLWKCYQRTKSLEDYAPYQCEAEQVHVFKVQARFEWRQVRQAAAWGPAHFHTHIPLSHSNTQRTHPTTPTPVMQKLMQPPCCLLPNSLILVLNPSHNPIDAVSHHHHTGLGKSQATRDNNNKQLRLPLFSKRLKWKLQWPDRNEAEFNWRIYGNT